ncbi:hypothetical protein DFJ73DRAFT_777673 [Zopfochytrium polystomum]|nr:hypothetical protein DFJ73DRAFT_777673 [Zopfochytrium polystomum]
MSSLLVSATASSRGVRRGGRAADTATPPSPPPPPPPRLYPGAPGAWLDFRVSLSSSSSSMPDGPVLFDLHLVACIFVPIILLYAAYVLWVKVVRPRSWPFRRAEGRLVPRANEASLVFVFVLLFFRWTHALILVLDALPVFAVRELSNDLTFAVFYFISSVFIISLVEGFQTVHRQEVDRIWSLIFPVVYFFPFCASVVGPLLGILSGLSADRADYADALRLVQVHYAYWASLFALNAVLAAIAGIKLRSRIGKSLAVATDPTIVRSLRSSRFTAMSMMVLHNIAMVSYLQNKRRATASHRTGGDGTTFRTLLRRESISITPESINTTRESISTTASVTPLSTSIPAAVAAAAASATSPSISTSTSSSFSSSFSFQYPTPVPHHNRHPNWPHSPAAHNSSGAALPPKQPLQSSPSAAWSSPYAFMPPAATRVYSPEVAAGVKAVTRYPPPSASGLTRMGDAGGSSGPT